MDHALIESTLSGLVAANSRVLERDCEQIALQYLAQQVEPQFDVDSADFDSDPHLICADRYWNHRFRAEPTLQTAVLCAGWMAEHVAAAVHEPIREKWALGYAFITRDSVESAGEIADATGDIVAADDSGCTKAYFATLYHAGKLRADFYFDELAQFLDASPLAMAAGPHRESVLFTALRAFAAFGSRRATGEYALELFDQVWSDTDRTYAAVDVALNGLAYSVEFDGRNELLRDRAGKAVAAYPGSHILHFRLATGQWWCGEHDAALVSIDTAVRLLPAIGGRVSHELLQEQYRARREAIEVARVNARHAAAARESAERTEAEITKLAETVRGSVVKVIEGVSIFAAIIAFAVGSLNISLNGSLSLGDRLWILAAFGGGLLLFALLVVGGTWTIVHRLSRRSR